MNKKHFFISLCWLVFCLSSCMKAQQADLIVHNASIHAMDDQVYEAMAIKDGKIIELGSERQILNKYSTKEQINAQKKDVYPGFSDAHFHLMLGAKKRLQIDLSACRSFDEVLLKLAIYQQENNPKIIVGYGWDEQKWRQKSFPTLEQLNDHFPTIPVCLFRTDEHTVLVNQAMLDLAQISTQTEISHGKIEKKDGKLTGILIDGALEKIREKIPPYSAQQLASKILEIQNELLMYGITNIHEAGINLEDIKLYQNLIDQKKLHINLYGMLLPDSSTIAFAQKKRHFTYKNLSIRSFKLFVDGALGSRGALLKKPYTDDPSTNGILNTTLQQMEQIADICIQTGYQLNAHAIGDSAIGLIFQIAQKTKEKSSNQRWRIEHAQVIDPQDLPLFAHYGIIPSIQAQHATSDYHFAQDRLGQDRIKNAYNYRTLLDNTGIISMGSDFPVANMNPFFSIYAACMRKNEDGQPTTGFLPHQAISLSECLLALTHWPAIASFQEDKIGQLKKGMDATFVIFDRKIDLQNMFIPNFALYTYINGVERYRAS